MADKTRPVPDGMVKTRDGYSYRQDVPEIDLQRDDILQGLFQQAETIQAMQVAFKGLCEQAVIEHFLSITPEITVDDIRQDIRDLWSLDGEMLLEIEYAPVTRGTEQIIKLKSLLVAAMDELPLESRAVVAPIIKAILRLDKGQSINLSQVARLQGVKAISSPSWDEAMVLLPECSEQVGVHPRFRFKRIDQQGNQTRVLENWSAVAVPTTISSGGSGGSDE